MIRKIQKFDIDDFLNMFENLREPKIIKDGENSLVDIVDEVLKSFDDSGEKIVKSKDYDIYKGADRINYEFLLAGFGKDEISVEIDDSQNLIVKAIKRKTDRQYIERNTAYEKFFKIKISESLINDNIKTDFTDGILTISFKEEQKQKNIKIL